MELIIISASVITCIILSIIVYIQYRQNYTLERENKLQSKAIETLRKRESMELVEMSKLRAAVAAGLKQIKENEEQIKVLRSVNERYEELHGKLIN